MKCKEGNCLNAIYLYRIGNWLYKHKIPIIPNLFWALTFLIFNSHVPYSAQIGKNTKFAYGGIGCVVHNRAIIGENCTIGSNVTIGGKSQRYEVPIIKDNVYIATGAKILGNVVIGSGSIIGANAVVVKDVPERCIVAGVPAIVIRENINVKEYI
jgi:serine O-acetyltransferase